MIQFLKTLFSRDVQDPDAVPEPESHLENFRFALRQRQFSDDPNTQSAAMLLIADSDFFLVDTNRLPEGVQSTPERLVRPEKYSWIEHAERNVIYQAAKTGLSARNGVLYSIWLPCMDCARAIIQAGIGKLIVSRQMHAKLFNDTNRAKWEADFARVEGMLAEAGVELEWFEEPIED